MTTQVFLTEEVKKRWNPILDADGVEPITDKNTRNLVTTVLENMLNEAPTNTTATGITATGDGSYEQDGTLDPVLIKLVRRAMPALIANDLVGVQPMTGPTGLIFAMKSWYINPTTGAKGDEAFAPGAAGDNAFSGTGSDPAGTGMAVGAGEILGSDLEVDATASNSSEPVIESNPWNEMSFTIEKDMVEAKTRALKAKYSQELAQDLRAIHGLDAATELSNILSTEIVREINREIVNLIYTAATTGCQNQDSGGPVHTAGEFDVGAADGRWSVEKYKMLMMQIVYEANLIAIATGRGSGNKLIVSPVVANALDMVSAIASDPVASQSNLGNTSGVGVTKAGTILGGRFDVFVDQYMATDKVVVGYKGSNLYDAGMFYCPYVPLQMMKSIGEEDFQPRIGFKTRYGIVDNPFGAANYYRSFTVTQVMATS